MTRLLPLTVVLERVPIGKNALVQLIAEGRFPRQVQITKRRVGGVELEITE